MRSLYLILALLLVACPAPKDKATRPPAPSAGAAIAGVKDVALQDLLSRHWDWRMERSPLWATQLGDHRFDDRIGDNSHPALEAKRKQHRAFLAEARALPAALLSPDDRTTLALFIEALEAEIDSEPCAFEEWNISARDNPVTDWNYLPELHPVTTPKDGAALLARYQQIPRWIDNQIGHLQRGLASGKVANAESTRRALKMLEAQLAQPFSDWPLASPAAQEHKDWPPAELEAFRRRLQGEADGPIRAALQRYHDFVEAEVLPRARPEDQSGLSALPNGRACYEARVRAHTTLKKSAEDFHAQGKAEIERINSEMRRLGEKLFGTQDLAAILKKLRDDRALYFSSSQEIEEKAESSLAVARARIPDYFGTLPRTDCVVRRIPDYEAPYTTIAYYRQPNPDGSKPGEYYVNVYQPETRPRYEAQVLAFHESIPGHHLQIAISQELPELPAFRKHALLNAYVEGWALYTEQLAEEMGLYSSDLDRMGMLSFDAWRASRLVVDSGIHALGWSREQAVQYMLEHTALSEANIRNEVDRYIVWPAQALSYKAGQLEIWRLRREAEGELGARFDIKGFHDAVLGRGAVSLSILEAQIREWVEARKKG